MLGAWSATDLSDASCAPVSGAVAALLTEAGAVLALRADAAAGLLPPDPGVVRAMLARAGGVAAMAMLVAVLLDHVPSVGPLLVRLASGPGGAAVGGAMETAAEVLLQQLEQADVMEVRIASGSLAEAGASAGRMVALLGGLEAGGKPERRRRVRALRERLDGCCLARFASGVEAAFPGRPAGGEVRDLETAARGLRVLETEARVLGSGAVYDRLLLDAAERVVGHDALAEPERVRLVEILRGPEAALAMLAERG
jgi:hypothetical protein